LSDRSDLSDGGGDYVQGACTRGSAISSFISHHSSFAPSLLRAARYTRVKNFCIADDKFLYFIFSERRYFMLMGYEIAAKNIAEKGVDFWILRSKTVLRPTKQGFCHKNINSVRASAQKEETQKKSTLHCKFSKVRNQFFQ